MEDEGRAAADAEMARRSVPILRNFWLSPPIPAHVRCPGRASRRHLRPTWRAAAADPRRLKASLFDTLIDSVSYSPIMYSPRPTMRRGDR